MIWNLSAASLKNNKAFYGGLPDFFEHEKYFFAFVCWRVAETRHSCL
jgi:hypothetical protein